MRNKGLLSLLIVFLFSFFTISPKAQGNTIDSINMHILLDDAGNATITEVWEFDASQGTEIYIIKDNLGNMEVANLVVTDETGRVFKDIGKWDINASFDKKAYKSGININGSAKELCFGISSYGKHTYTIQYTMTNFVSRYTDNLNGFNQRVINDQLSAAPNYVRVVIEKENTEFTNENTNIWAFGYDGTIFVENGKIVAETNSAIGSSNHMTILTSFNVEMFNPTNISDKSFEEVKTLALEGSDYTPENDYDPDYEYDYNYGISSFVEGIFSIFFTFFPVIIVGAIIALSKKKSSSTGYSSKPYYFNNKNVDYYRDVPFNGDLFSSHYAIQKGHIKYDKSSIIGAFLLKWQINGNVIIDEETTKGFLGLSEKKQAVIKFSGIPENMEYEEKQLYDMLVSASGKDKILQENEFMRWSSSHYERIDSWYSRIDDVGEINLVKQNFVEQYDKPGFLGLGKVRVTDLTQSGIKKIEEMMGFKKYLEDFTIINEREVKEVELWGNYLVFATFFGIADKVAASFKDIYPKYFEERVDTYQGGYMSYLYTMRMINAMSRAAVLGASQGRQAAESRSMGGGGGASFGGGGGFSGGGSGGGFR